jgi:hypothetical protein
MSDRTFQTPPTRLQEAPERGEAATPASPQRRRGRRPSHAEHWTKVTVVLFSRQVVFLDRLIADIRATSGAAISRAHLIRVPLADSDLDLTGTRSEADLTAVLTHRLRHGSRDSAR